MKKPPALKSKDKVALVAPASRPARPSVVKRSAAIIKEMGFTPVLGKNLLASHGFSAGTDRERLDDLGHALRDESIRAVWCITGGYGCLPLLADLPYGEFAASPKIVLGCEDASHLTLALHKRSGVVTFHGPNADRVVNRIIFERVKRAFTHGDYDVLQAEDAVLPEFAFSAVEGIGKGALLAGNLTSLVALFGTGYEPDLDGRVLLLDDVRERNDILDRWFTTLYISGKLSAVAALGLGMFEGCDSRGAFNMLSFEELAYDRLVEMALPSCFNLPFGQGGDHVLPLGVQVSLDTQHGKLTFLESALSR